ncbi:g-protein coupled receptor 1-like [Anaeramoeba ignava]|uniref:G-protein coupled receptor 1-like n=1 Tax=Anaeramoeba ignava TaxID=1746090 RepID=A0A9Q0LWI5_ANAIG|nr:g-protein coupled receptor 1-like [Anaeramoeba ignava]
MVSKLISSEEISTIIGASLGSFGALMIIIIFIYFKEYKIFYRKLVFVLSIYDFFQSITYLLPGFSNKIICEIQFYLIAIFGTTPLFWAATISVISYLKVVKEFNDKKSNKIYKWIHLFLLILIIILIVIATYFHDFNSPKTYWCSSTTKISVIIIFSFVWIYVIICLIFYILTMIRLRKLIKLISKGYSLSKKHQTDQIWIQLRMSLIPLIEIIVTIPITIRRIREIINSSFSEIMALDIISSLLICSQGFWDFWIFIIFDPEIRSKLKNCRSYSYSKYYQENPFGLDFFDPKNDKDLYSIKDSEEKNRIREIINPSVSEILSLDILSSLLLCSQGFWDFWIFIIFDPEIRSKLKNCSSSKKYQEVDLVDFQNEEELRMENNF